MTDVFSRDQRSRIMAKVRGQDTKPELTVRKTVYALGYRYRLGGAGLPGKPDLVFPRRKKVIFVHGCFWHGHEECKRSARPTTNEGFWNKKLSKNVERDRRKIGELEAAGWQVLVIWQCELKRLSEVSTRLAKFLQQAT